MKGEIKTASNSIVVFYFSSQDLQKMGTSTKICPACAIATSETQTLLFLN
jgi:hypothetical protein